MGEGRGGGPAEPRRFALLALGFRPFYLLASAFAALSVPLWALQFGGYLDLAVLGGSAWHGHEMLFGYTMAVIAGFLLTAVRTWSGQPTPTGAALAALALLWVAGRVLVLTPWALAAAVANALFPLAVAVAIGIALARGGNRRNYFFVVLLALASAVVLALHLSMMGVLAWPARASLQVGLDGVLFIVAVIAGRVVPMFTNNGVPGAGATRRQWLETAALASVLAMLAADLLGAGAAAVVPLALFAMLAHGARLALWRPWKTLGTPLVWVLHAAYAWIPVHFALRALAALGAVADTLAVHALTLGVIGGMTIGMMTRTARGHTARALRADAIEVLCYLLVLAAALVRVFGPMALPSAYLGTVTASALLWSAAFAIYFVRYWPFLTRPRLDGKPG
ncbi:MAG TPA: NnrS family protein [Myxococcota bacterium]|nr:NnrS family protein [Myxococcota bacterium]